MVALLKWIGYLLSTGITTTPVAGGATEAKQDIGNTSLSVLDDWDETDRAKVNVIAGQAGVAAGAGASSAATPRVVTASDSPEIALFGAVNETAPATDTASSGANGRLQRIAQRITSLIALVPASLGGKTAAASFAVTTATDDPPLALLGAVAETAPATDTASSGLNGRLQRIAQRVTSVIAL
ncbi:MAG: hypothetical protein Q7R45_07330, partial [Sulfuricaulis sp.]|nr:hypothetical protein [Sulfuricaulis sp.]